MSEVQGRSYWRQRCEQAEETVAKLRRELSDARRDIRGEVDWRVKLQRALSFWLPMVPEGDDEIAERVAADAWLLCELSSDQEPDMESPSAQALGWVTLRARTEAPKGS